MLIFLGGCASILGADFERAGAEERSAPADAAGDAPATHCPDGEVECEDGCCAAVDDDADAAKPRDGGTHADAAAAGDGMGGGDAGGAPCTPSCESGQRCLAGQCVCDAVSCSGSDRCCRKNRCDVRPGAGIWSACGPAGGQCESCDVAEVCRASDSSCVALGTAVRICATNNGPSSFDEGCAWVCGSNGKSCATGCFSNPDYGGEHRLGCTGAVKALIVGCEGKMTIAPGESLRCCCAD